MNKISFNTKVVDGEYMESMLNKVVNTKEITVANVNTTKDMAFTQTGRETKEPIQMALAAKARANMKNAIT